MKRQNLRLALVLSLCLLSASAPPRSAVDAPRPAEIQRALNAARSAFIAADYQSARQYYVSALSRKLREYDRASVLTGLGACDIATGRNADALRHYDAASEIADAGGFVDLKLIIASNKATIYRRMADTGSAMRLMKAVERLVPRSGDSLVIAQFATAIRDVSFARAMALYVKALDVAAAAGDRRAESIIWNQIGTSYEERGQFPAAEHAFTEAFRIRSFSARTGLQPGYFYLGRLRLRQGDYRSAIRLLETARDLTRPTDSQIRLPYVHHSLARAYYADGQTVRALREFAAAVRTMTNWRSEVLPADSFRVTSEVFAQQIFNDYINAGMAAYRETGDETVAARMLEVAQDSRDWLMQQPAGSGQQQGLQLSFRKLKPSEAFIGFHLGTGASYVWAVTAKSFEAHRLAGREALAAGIQEFRTALLEHKGDIRLTGKAVSQSVIGSLSRPVRGKREWILSLDGPLFDLPFAALPEENGWLAERHSLRLSSSRIRERRSWSGNDEFVALADPVYNRADDRARVPATIIPVTELPRLHGTAREANACAHGWGQDLQPELVTGTAVTREELMRAVAARPAVLHLATHVIPHPSFQDQAVVALGLQQSGQMEYLEASDIASSRMQVGLVTLSGCGSGRGAALPGLGLFGLTRAWLMAGATAVVATQWPVADDSGELLAAMYEQLRQIPERLSASKAAAALQAAQLRMIQGGGWRSDPVYWSAFAVIGKD